MWNPAKSTDRVKEKLPACEKLTISIRKKSDKTVRIFTGLSFDQILQELGINKRKDFHVNNNSDGSLNGPERLVLNSSSSNNVNCLKTSSTFSSHSGKSEGQNIKIRLAHSLSKHGTHSRLLSKSFVATELNSNSRIEKAESGCKFRKVNIDTCHSQAVKRKCEFNQSFKENKFSNCVQEQVDTVSKVGEESGSRICIIKEVLGNAVTTFSSNDDVTGNVDAVGIDSKEPQLIVPKKTDDITKIKGWRRKQFFVEKPTTVEFQEFSYDNGVCNKVTVEPNVSKPNSIMSNNHVKNAFVCESLDEFLEQDAGLKIDYEIPHLFAEFGIKLTKEEIASAPSLSENDRKEVETKYQRSIPSHDDIINLDDLKSDKIKRGKRQSPEDSEESFKAVKLENGCVRLVKTVKRLTDKETNCCYKSPSTMQHESKENNVNKMKLSITDLKRTANVSGIKLTSKVLGLVVYPSPYTPLHPIVQFHLRKLRSYHTAIDSNWANFAASVVIHKDSKYERCILPAICCVKVLNDPVSSEEKVTKVTPTAAGAGVHKVVEFKPAEEAKSMKKIKEDQCSQPTYTKIFSVEELERMKNCRVVIKKLDTKPGSKSLCTEHNRLKTLNKNCNIKNFKSILKPLPRKETEEDGSNKEREYEKPVLRTSQPDFYEDIVNLLEKKLKIFHPESLTSIDSLKTLNLNAVELIKLKFIQKSFWHKYISIWFLKPEKADVRSRAFLTFSKTPPVPNAIHLRCGLVVNDLPKVIREIIHAEKCVDPNEFVLLYCNGDYWEIHGSVNVAFNKSIKTTEQVMIPPELPELKNLQDISFKMLKVKSAKWWVLDLTQQFQIIELKSEKLIAIISQKKLLDFVQRYSSGFMPLRTNSGGRIFGAYMMQNLLPYILIGPYYFSEVPDMTLRGDFATLPFLYNEVKDVNENIPLKFHISSVIKKTKKNGKTVEGLWLHCRTFASHTCFLEVMTACGASAMPRGTYSIHEEHGYSMNSASLQENNCKTVDNCHGDLQVEVYLYFDIFGLGYVLGVLEEDNSVTITHPLNERTKVNSTEIGNWFIGILKRRIRFVPKNLIVNWFITRHKSHLRNRPPFNKNFLNGAHILTDSGVFYVLKLTSSNTQDSILKTSSILEAAGKSSVIEEVVYLKILSDMLVRSVEIKPKMDEVLTAAVKEITRLKKKLNLLERVKACLEEEKLGLFNSYLMTIHLKGLNKKLSVTLLKRIEQLFFSDSGKIGETYLKKLKLYSFGRLYLKTVEKEKQVALHKTDTTSNNLGE